MIDGIATNFDFWGLEALCHVITTIDCPIIVLEQGVLIIGGLKHFLPLVKIQEQMSTQHSVATPNVFTTGT